MKVQYLGDVNDYRKYALLRLLANSGLRLGVNWMLTPDDDRSDGNKRSYLGQPEEWRSHDPELFDLLAGIPEKPTLDNFQQIERWGIVPDAVYFDRFVPRDTPGRDEFHSASMEAFIACDIVFFDPDNGLVTASTSKGRKDGIKFVFDDELAGHYNAGCSLLVYQHFPREERIAYISKMAGRLRRFAPDAAVWACNTSHVVFMLVANPQSSSDHVGRIEAAVETGRRRWPTKFIHFQFQPA